MEVQVPDASHSLDLLAEASLAARLQESSAAHILQTLCHESSQDCPNIPLPLPSPTSEDTISTEPRAEEDDAGARRDCGFDACEWDSFDGRASHSAHRWDEQTENIKGACRPLRRGPRVVSDASPRDTGPWSAIEDAQLIALVREHGGKHWARIASMLPGRTGKQCRERWCNNLDPSLKKGSWSAAEDETILAMHAKLGTRWAEIAKSLPGRSDNSVR